MFCKFMSYVLYEFLDKFVVLYLDDIAIYSEFVEEHVMHFKLVFSKLMEYVLYVERENCEFYI